MTIFCYIESLFENFLIIIPPKRLYIYFLFEITKLSIHYKAKNCNENKIMNSIKVSAQTASLTLGGNSNEDDESIFTLHERDSSQNSIISANDTCSQTNGKMRNDEL